MIVYSRPPYPDMEYPYILVNVFDETSFNYINPKKAKSVIVDSGVYSVFSRLSLKEYPGGYMNWIAKAVRWWRRVKALVPETYVTIPDYPTDYAHNQIEDNIERTLRNIEYAVSKYPDVSWIIPVQGKMNDVVSIVKNFEYLASLGLFKRYNYAALASICTSRNIKIIHDIAYLIWKRVKQLEKQGTYIRVHAFGISIKAWKQIAPYVDSTDTIITNYWCLPLIGKMCTTREEKEKAWQIFLQRVAEVGSIRRL